MTHLVHIRLKRKYQRGRCPKDEIWVFGTVDTSYSPALGYMEIVEKRDAKTLLPIIQSVVLPGSVVHSDEWRAYRNIERDLGLEHSTVNHSKNFVSLDGTHAQNVELYCNWFKVGLKSMKGVRRQFLHFYLQEFMWRERCRITGENIFSKLIEHIALFYVV